MTKHYLIFLIKDYVEISVDDYSKYVYNPKQGGWRLYGYLVERGLIHEVNDYFDLVKDFNFKPHFKEAEEVIPLLLEVGAIPILAHPPAYIEGDLYPIEKLDFWRKLGVKGLECYTQYTKVQSNSKYYVDYCNKYGLYISGGSDCHGGFVGRQLGYPKVTEDMIRIKW